MFESPWVLGFFLFFFFLSFSCSFTQKCVLKQVPCGGATPLIFQKMDAKLCSLVGNKPNKHRIGKNGCSGKNFNPDLPSPASGSVGHQDLVRDFLFEDLPVFLDQLQLERRVDALIA